MFLFEYEAKPKATNPQHGQLAGAYINCWISRATRREAELGARSRHHSTSFIQACRPSSYLRASLALQRVAVWGEFLRGDAWLEPEYSPRPAPPILWQHQIHPGNTILGFTGSSLENHEYGRLISNRPRMSTRNVARPFTLDYIGRMRSLSLSKASGGLTSCLSGRLPTRTQHRMINHYEKATHTHRTT